MGFPYKPPYILFFITDKWKGQLKEYEKKKDVYDRIHEGEVSRYLRVS